MVNRDEIDGEILEEGKWVKADGEMVLSEFLKKFMERDF